MSVKTKIRIGLLLRGPRRFGALSRAPFRRSVESAVSALRREYRAACVL